MIGLDDVVFCFRCGITVRVVGPCNRFRQRTSRRHTIQLVHGIDGFHAVIRPRQAIAEIIIGIDNRRSAVTLRIRFRSQPVQLIVSKRQIPVFAPCAVFRDRGTHACRIDLIFMMSADLFLMLPYIQDEFTNRCSKYPNNQITEYCTS